MTDEGDQQTRRARVSPPLALARLVRLPNVFTAWADVMMGCFFVTPVGDRVSGTTLGLLVAATSCLYCAGMVLNDVFDYEVDAKERPDRPLPAGDISLSNARRLGFGLLAAGIALGWLITLVVGDWRSGAVATGLAVCVLLYDGVLKKTPIAPLAMGGCRMLNVLLGMSVAATAWEGVHYLVAGGMGIYIVGVTWFARQEARQSSQLMLAGGLTVMMGGIVCLAMFPRLAPNLLVAPLSPQRWDLFIAAIGAVIALRCVWAIFEPTPTRVQAAVKQSILSLIVLNAAITLAVQGPLYTVLVIFLLFPASQLGRKVYST